MFDNVGGKIKTYAKVVCYIGIAAAVIFGIMILIASKNKFLGFLGGVFEAALLAFFAWLSSLFVYAFGEVVEKVNDLENHTKVIEEKINKIGSGE